MAAQPLAGPSTQNGAGAHDHSAGGPTAGPSSPLSLSDLLLPSGNTDPSPLSGSQDLLALFHLSPLYDTYVRPYITLPTPAPGESPAAPGGGGGGGKGKGKEREASGGGGGISLGFTIGGVRVGGTAVVQGTDADKLKKVKMDKSYAHLISDIPGRNTIKKDKHLLHLVMNPDVQPVHVAPFDAHSLRDAFSLKPGQIPGFDAMIWETEADVPKRKKKKRKHDGETPGAAPGGGGSASGVGEDEHRKKKKRKADGSP